MPKSKKSKKIAKKSNQSQPKETDLLANLPVDIPHDAKKRLEDIKVKLDKYQKKVLGRFEEYVMGMALLPPSKVEDVEKKEERKLSEKEAKELTDRINVLLLLDDADSHKMSKEELKEKLSQVMVKMAHEVDKHLYPEVIILSELWQSCYDAKYDLLQMVAMAAPVYDKGMLAAVKIAEIHKSMVLKKFEKYIVSYVLAGSLVQGRATPKSDIDVFIVVDDTDVKKMTRVELKDKLRAIIISMGIEAGKMTGIENKLNVQVYILTDFWDSIKEANPVIFTFLRDGIPFYDRGIFMPWKQLLQMGRIKPSPEAIDMFMSTGEQMLDRIKNKLREIAVEDFFWATITPSQAAIMLYGLPPPTPKETPELLRELFVKKEKIYHEDSVKVLDKVLKLRKDIEHGESKNVSGARIDELLKESTTYLKELKKLFGRIDELKERESIVHVYDDVIVVIRDILRYEGITKVKDVDVPKFFEQDLVKRGILPAKLLRLLKSVIDAKKAYDKGKITKSEIQSAQKTSRELIKALIEHLQRKRGQELERVKLRVKHGDRYGEVILLDRVAFIIHDIDHEEKEITKAVIKENGALGRIEKSSLEELEKALAKMEIPSKVFIKQPIFTDLAEIFGKDVEVLVNY